jgi:ABC-type dipeptide/oligopeptide/nickel transport system permease subunit
VIVLLCLVAIFADVLAPLPYTRRTSAVSTKRLASLSARTDQLGRDLLSRMIYGARVSMLVGLGAQLIVVAIGVPIGALSATSAGAPTLLTRFIDVMYAFRAMLFVILVMSMLGAGLMNIFIAIGLTGWVGIARQTRAQVLSHQTKGVRRGRRALGSRAGRLLFRHVLPNALTPIVVAVTFGIPEAIFTEAALSFIGVGINPPTPSWGQMVGEGQQYIRSYLASVRVSVDRHRVTMLAFTFFGDGVRDALDPKNEVAPEQEDCMKRPPISDAQMDLLATRLRRRASGGAMFLRIAAGLAALGRRGFNARPVSAAPKLAPARSSPRTSTSASAEAAGGRTIRPATTTTRTSTAAGVPALWAGLMKFTADFQPVPYVAERVSSNADGSVWTFNIRKDSKWSDGSPCTARDFEWSWKRQMDPREQESLLELLLRHQGRRAFNKGKVPDASQVGVQARTTGRWSSRSRAHAGTSPCSPPISAALPATSRLGRKARRQVDGGGQPRLQRSFTLEAWEHNKVDGAAQEQALSQRQGRDAGEGHDPDHSRAVGRAAVREQRARHDVHADRRPQAAARRSADKGRCSAIRSRARGTSPAGDEAAVRQREGARASGTRSIARTWCAWPTASPFRPTP